MSIWFEKHFHGYEFRSLDGCDKIRKKKSCNGTKFNSFSFTNITLVQVELDLVDKKNIVGRGDPTKSDHPASLMDISHQH